MKRLILLALLAPLPALASTTCHFDQECFEAEPCAAADFTLELSGDVSTILTEFGDLTVTHDLTQGDSYVVLAEGEGAAYLLSMAQDGGARLTTHMGDGPMMVGYLGRCEETR